MINPGSRLLCATCRTSCSADDPTVRSFAVFPQLLWRQRQPEYFASNSCVSSSVKRDLHIDQSQRMLRTKPRQRQGGMSREI